MLTIPQASTRPSSRSSSKEREDLDKNTRIESANKNTEKGQRENSNNMGDDMNASNEGHMNHLEKSDSDEDEDESEEVSSFYCN